MTSRPLRVAIVSSGSPELLHLARALADDGALVRFVTPFNVPEPARAGVVLRTLGRHPRVARNLTKRESAGIDRELLRSASPAAEVLRTVVAGRLRRAATWAHRRSNAQLRKAAARLAQQVDVLVVSHGCASDIPDQRRARVVLNQPNAHPAYQVDASEQMVHRYAMHTRETLPAYAPPLLARLGQEYDLADLILVGSTFVSSTLQAHGVSRDKIRICPYGVDTDMFQPSQGPRVPGPLRAISVSSLAPHKGVAELLAAVDLLQPGSATIAHFGGSPFGGEWLPNSERIARGRVTHVELATHLAAADCFVLASWFEGLPLSVLEALACGLPCVVTATGADQVVRDGVEGFIVPTGDPGSIAQALQRLAEDGQLLRTMSRAARRRAETFTWEVYAGRVINAINGPDPKATFQHKGPHPGSPSCSLSPAPGSLPPS